MNKQTPERYPDQLKSAVEDYFTKQGIAKKHLPEALSFAQKTVNMQCRSKGERSANAYSDVTVISDFLLQYAQWRKDTKPNKKLTARFAEKLIKKTLEGRNEYVRQGYVDKINAGDLLHDDFALDDDEFPTDKLDESDIEAQMAEDMERRPGRKNINTFLGKYVRLKSRQPGIKR